MRAVTYRYLHVLHRFMDKGAQQPYGAKAEPLPPLFVPIPPSSVALPPLFVVPSVSLFLSLRLFHPGSLVPLCTPIRHACFNSLIDLCSLITSANVVPIPSMLQGTHRDVHNQGLHISLLRGTRVWSCHTSRYSRWDRLENGAETTIP